MPTNGALRSWVIGIVGAVLTSLLVYSILSLVSVRDRLGSLEASLGVSDGARGLIAMQSRVTVSESRLLALEQWRNEGRRFTREDGDRMAADTSRQIETLRHDLDELRRDVDRARR